MTRSLCIWLVVALLGGALVAGCGSSDNSATGISGPTVVVTAPGPTRPPLGEVLFSGNFQTGNISQWTWGAQCANYALPGHPEVGDVYVVTAPEPVAQGTYSARFELPASENNNICEVLRKRTEALGTDDWYAQEVYFPPSWHEPSTAFWGDLFGQYNYEDIGSGPPVGLYAHADHVNIGIESGLCDDGPCEYNSGNDIGGGNEGTLKTTLRLTPLGTKLAGTWQQFVVHVHWAADSSGLVQGWWRPLGGTWTKTVNWGGYPTVQWTSSQPPETNYTTADKIGSYRGPSTFPLSIWQEGLCVATSFSAAASCF